MKKLSLFLGFIFCLLLGLAFTWRPHAKTVFIGCKLGKQIKPDGWHNWGKPEAEKYTFYAEYKSTGPGANPKARVPWAKQLTDEEAEEFTPEKVLGDWKPGAEYKAPAR